MKVVPVDSLCVKKIVLNCARLPVKILVRIERLTLHRERVALGIFLPLITTNCAILGLCLFIYLWQVQTLLEAAVLSFGAGIGFTLAICIMAGIRENLELADVPAPLRGAPITLITAGLLTLAFMGFAGMIR